ncbi:TPA: hypothetical protein DCX15_00965 [bacterium]|nr:hypothetical protein [bacterium]
MSIWFMGDKDVISIRGYDPNAFSYFSDQIKEVLSKRGLKYLDIRFEKGSVSILQKDGWKEFKVVRT